MKMYYLFGNLKKFAKFFFFYLFLFINYQAKTKDSLISFGLSDISKKDRYFLSEEIKNIPLKNIFLRFTKLIITDDLKITNDVASLEYL